MPLAWNPIPLPIFSNQKATPRFFGGGWAKNLCKVPQEWGVLFFLGISFEFFLDNYCYVVME